MFFNLLLLNAYYVPSSEAGSAYANNESFKWVYEVGIISPILQ